MLKDFHVLTGKTLLYFGPTSTSKAERKIQAKRTLIVTGSTSARISGALDDFISILKKKGAEYSVYDGVKPNPTIHIVREITRKALDEKVEQIIAIGGGSVIDAAKLACVAAAEHKDPQDYLYGKAKATRNIPLVAVNLTHGTGTEVDRYSVINVPENQDKKGISTIYPELSVDNPKYTLTLPPKQVIATSIDALYHIIESYLSEYSSPYIRDLDEKAITYIVEHLPLATLALRDINHRYWLQYASMLAGIAIDHGFTYIIHAIEHGLSGVNPKLEHGIGLGIIGPHMIKLIYKAMPEDTSKILRFINPKLRPRSEDAVSAEKALKKFQKSVGFSYALSDYGFTAGEVAKAVRKAWPLVQRRLGGKEYIREEDVIKELNKIL